MSDFHCHLDLYPDARRVYAETLLRNEFTWLVTTSPRAFAATSRVLPATERLLISPGLHPEVAVQKATELELLLQQIPGCAAVGEVGLDGSSRFRPSYSLQRDIFSSVVKASAQAGGRILSVHSRGAVKDVLETFEANPGFGTAVLHWFSGTPAELKKAVAVGCWFSVGPAMLTSANGRNLASLMPRERLVPESDGPFAQIKGAPVMPWDAASICELLASLWGMQRDAAESTLKSNSRRLQTLLESQL